MKYFPESGEILRNGRKCGTVNVHGYRVIRLSDKGCFKFLYAHRIAWFMAHGAWPIHDIDHINGDKSDNRLCNLREATRAQNLSNLGKRANNSTGFKGVFKAKMRWKAQIQIRGKAVYLGQFGTREEASAAYNEASRRLQGEFSYLNGVAA
nr:HNH endonuclease [Luteibacter sp. SG786]